MAKDMKMYTHRVLENSILQTCRYQFKSLKKVTENYLDLIKVWKKEVNSPLGTSYRIKTNLPILYFILSSNIENCLIQFSDPECIKFLAKLYIDTSVLYTALLRDGHFNGFSIGLHQSLINETTPDEITFSTKLELHSKEVFSNYMFILSRFLYENDHLCDDGPNLYKPYHTVSDWSGTISLFLYSHVKTYDRLVQFDRSIKGPDRVAWEFIPKVTYGSYYGDRGIHIRNNGTRVTNQQISEYSIYDRFVFETERFVDTSNLQYSFYE